MQLSKRLRGTSEVDPIEPVSIFDHCYRFEQESPQHLSEHAVVLRNKYTLLVDDAAVLLHWHRQASTFLHGLKLTVRSPLYPAHEHGTLYSPYGPPCSVPEHPATGSPASVVAK
jgi:hypothetical protein